MSGDETILTSCPSNPSNPSTADADADAGGEGNAERHGDEPRPPLRDALREALACWPSGVTVVTTLDLTARPRGFTASSFTSLSMDPPLVLVCLDRGADCRPAFEHARTFAVHILGSEQHELARRFASRDVDKFAGTAVRRGLGGAPLLDGAAARLECRMERSLPGGDHVILVGRVERIVLGRSAPLLYHQRAFVPVPERAPAPTPKTEPGQAPTTVPDQVLDQVLDQVPETVAVSG